MEKRFILALVLTGVVIALTPMLTPKRPVPIVADSTAVVASTAASPVAGAPTTPPVAPVATATTAGAANAPAATPAAPTVIDTVTVKTPLSQVAFSSVGAAPLRVQVDSFAALNGKGGRVVLHSAASPLLRYRVVTATDTIALDRTPFQHTTTTGADGAETVVFRGASGARTAQVTYTLKKDNYLSTVAVQVDGLTGPAFLLVDLPTGFVTQEADSTDDIVHLSYAVKPQTASARGTPFSKLDPGEKKLETGPLTWAVAKSKYFLVGLLVPTGGTPFSEAHLEGAVRTGKRATQGMATVVMPLANGATRFELYAGPQSWERLRAMGREFETANPYGGFMQGVVQPFSTIVMRVMLWLKKIVGLNYGWVLVIFGAGIRLLMWPLNQSAMRSTLKMQRIQPELQEVQARYKSDPVKAQAEMMKIYAAHNMSPFSAFSGCLPALIPMPVFFALFFVFQNTIEFRGVPFLWLHDISLRDPFFILPVITAISMFVLSWIGTRNMPKNQQTQMMLYLMPAMFLFFLINTASGLSIYYFVQQLAAIPQQWLIANERAKATPVVRG